MCALNLHGSLVDHITLLARGITTKDKSMTFVRATLTATHASLSTVQEYLENLHLENASLAWSLSESSTSSVTAISESFESVLQQVENFHPPLRISREEVRPDRMLNDENIVLHCKVCEK